MRRTILGGICAVLVALALARGGQPNVHANGVPQLVKLTYLDGVSNFGPKDGEGVLEFSFAEAYARVDVKNLKPMDGYTFEGWLEGPGAPLYVGKIAVNASGIGTLSTKLSGLSSYNFNVFVVAARKTGSPDGQRPSETSIAGRFTVIGDDGKSPSGGDVRPASLPDTGEKPPMSTSQRVGRTLTITAASGGLAFVFFRVFRRRRVTDD